MWVGNKNNMNVYTMFPCAIQSTFIHIIILKVEKKDPLGCDMYVCVCVWIHHDEDQRMGEREGSERQKQKEN